MATTRLFCGRSDRLIARVKMMLYAWRFIEQVDGQLIVFWPSLPSRYAEEDIDYSPSLIFDLVDFYAKGGSDQLVFVESNQRPPSNAVALDGPQFSSQVQHGFDRAMFVDGGVFSQSGSPQFRFSDEPSTAAYMMEGVKRLFRSLPVHPQVLAARADFYARHRLEPGSFDTIHVRRGDVYDMLRAELPGWPTGQTSSARLDLIINHFIARTAPLEFYRPAVEAAITRGRTIVFTSDTPAVIADFRKAFGQNLFTDLSALRMRVPIQKAFADFLVLGDSAQIIGTSSNFSALPAELAGVPFQNVAGSGDYAVAEATFRAAFLDGHDAVDSATATEALDRLQKHYADFAARRAASSRARERAANAVS